MADLNKAPNDFFDNWKKIQSMSYKNVIELHVKRSSEKKILALIQFEIDQFPEDVQKDLVISEASSFYKEISNLLTEGKNNANKILKKHKKELELLADALLKYETLDADQFRALMEGKELDIKVIPTPDTKIKDKEKSENPKTKKGYPEPQSS